MQDVILDNDGALALSEEEQEIARMMLKHRGDLSKVAREPSIPYNVMTLRRLVAANDQIRLEYGNLLRQALETRGLHASERIMKMADLQDQAFGDEENQIPPDPAMAIKLSQELSRLILEAKGIDMSSSASARLVSRKDPAELLEEYITS